jgi:hypothetical protein
MRSNVTCPTWPARVDGDGLELAAVAGAAIAAPLDGSGHRHVPTHVCLDPEADARLSASLDAAVAAERAKAGACRSFDQLRAAGSPRPSNARRCAQPTRVAREGLPRIRYSGATGYSGGGCSTRVAREG